MMNDTQILRAETSAPTHAGARPSTASSLPDDLYSDSVRRLGILALVYAIAYSTAFGEAFFLDELWEHLHLKLRPDDLVIAGASVLISLGFFALTRSSTLSRRALLRLGLVYGVIGAYCIEIGRFWLHEPPILGGLSWSCVWILFFSVACRCRAAGR